MNASIGKRVGNSLNKLTTIILVISIAGNLLGLFFAYEFLMLRKQVARLQSSLKGASESVGKLTDIVDRSVSSRMVFLHHSVGKRILNSGGLADSLLAMGVAVRGATYGDEVGERTDVCDWLPKFQRDLDRILKFKAHPNIFYSDGTTNDIVMFKSCFPNSDIKGDGAAPGNPISRDKTIVNYKATLAGVTKELSKHPKTLFVYLTFPPLVPEETTPEAAGRARAFNQWVQEELVASYRKETGLDNLAVFDLFDILADAENMLLADYRTGRPNDSHPNELANREVARRFMEFFKPIWARWQQELGTAS